MAEGDALLPVAGWRKGSCGRGVASDMRSNWEFLVKSRGLASGFADLGGLNGRLNDSSLDVGSFWKSIPVVTLESNSSSQSSVGCQCDA